MTTEIPVTQARDELAELINRVAYGHERIILTRHSKAVACLVPPEDLQRLESEPLESEGQTGDQAHLGRAATRDRPAGAAADRGRAPAARAAEGLTGGTTSGTNAPGGAERKPSCIFMQ